MYTSAKGDRKSHHTPVEANELVYVDKDRKKSDQAIHEAILNGISREGAERMRQAAYARARKRPV
jgi:hypothetical protein